MRLQRLSWRVFAIFHICTGKCAHIIKVQIAFRQKLCAYTSGVSSMYSDPDEVETKTSTLKTDPTASARSAIRRQRTVRYSPNTRQPSFHSTSSTSYRPGSSHGRTRAISDRRSLLEDIRRTAPANPSQHTAAEVANLEAALHNHSSARAADIAHNRASQRSRIESGRPFLRDQLSYERGNEHLRLGRHTTVPEAPETHQNRSLTEFAGAMEQLGQDFAARHDFHSTNLRQDHWPTPPYSSGESSENSPVHRSIPPPGTTSLTPRFAPAHRLSNEVVGEAVVDGQTYAARQSSLALLAERIPRPSDVYSLGDQLFLDNLSTELQAMRDRTPDMLSMTYLASEATLLRRIEFRLNRIAARATGGDTFSNSVDDLPPLRRMDHIQDNSARRAQAERQYRRRAQHARTRRQDTLDGLGDRQRSFSPDDDAWETMLMTITPDERVPSAHSSFTTATASASASATTSRRSINSAASSYGTLVTVPSTYADREACPADGEGSDFVDDDDVHAEDEGLSFTEENWSMHAGGAEGGGIRTPRYDLHRRTHGDGGVGGPSNNNNNDSSSGSSLRTYERTIAALNARRESRIEALHREYPPQRSHGGGATTYHANRSRDMARDEEVRRLESSVRGLERQVAEERSAAGRQRPEERL